MRSMKFSRFILSLAATALLSGCFIIPFVQAFKETGATEGDRMALLEPEARKFADAMVLGNKKLAMTVVMPESRSSISKLIRDRNEEERVVESKLDDVQYSEAARKATVTLKVRYYKVPFYVVKMRIEEQHWEFTMSDGWKLRDMAELDEEEGSDVG